MAPFWLSRRGKQVAAVTVHRQHEPVASCELALSSFWFKGHLGCKSQDPNGTLLHRTQAYTSLLLTIFYIHTSDFFSKFFKYSSESKSFQGPHESLRRCAKARVRHRCAFPLPSCSRRIPADFTYTPPPPLSRGRGVKQVEGKPREAEPRMPRPEGGQGESMTRLPHCCQSSEEEGADCTPRSVFWNCSDLVAFASIIHLLSS